MPELPLSLTLTTGEQLRAVSDPTRERILGLIQHQPATAKQIADRLEQPPSTIGHHLRVLKEAGLVQVVARRLVRGIVAKYYTRTARIFTHNLPPETAGNQDASLHILTQARDELAEALAAYNQSACLDVGYPRARITPERAQAYKERLDALVMDFLSEPVDPHGQLYGFASALFRAPPFAQVLPPEADAATPASHSDDVPGD
jgi:DNA-binding transcriptional ArsR family regulator